MSTFSLYFRSSYCHFVHFQMSQKRSGNDDDDFEFPSDEEVQVSEDQRIMDDLILKEQERVFRASQRRWIRSQTEGNTLINSSKNIFH